MRLIAAFIVLLLSAPAEARCICQCVDAKFQPLCDSAKDKPASCTRNDYAKCPPLPQSSAPPPPLPAGALPAGAKRCRMAQVYVPLKTHYEWRRVCD
jgi:hypothetical protein